LRRGEEERRREGKGGVAARESDLLVAGSERRKRYDHIADT
jgi:hypothetical protein